MFEDLPPGTYHTVLTPPSPEYLLSPKADDGDTDFNPDTFQTTPITLNSGESGEGSFDAGLYLPAKIGDRVWYDTELNGLQDADEGPFTDAIVTITLRDSLGYVVDTTNPAPGTGFYEFDGLRPGTYGENNNIVVFECSIVTGLSQLDLLQSSLLRSMRLVMSSRCKIPAMILLWTVM